MARLDGEEMRVLVVAVHQRDFITLGQVNGTLLVAHVAVFVVEEQAGRHHVQTSARRAGQRVQGEVASPPFLRIKDTLLAYTTHY